ncbi:GspH/FimT family pseudopilin [Aquipseudomonas alcaligenes]|nr:GspH/FimT family pseudopilin [Pseudomonas alcaligenes]
MQVDHEEKIMPCRPSTKGFSLIELMITISLLGIALAIATPNLTRMVRNQQVEAQAQTINSLMQFARAEAVIRRTPVTISNAGNVWTVSTSTEVLRRETFDTGQADIATSPSPLSLTYSSNGASSSVGETRIIVCRDDMANFAYLVTIEPSGSSRIHNRGHDSDTTLLGDCVP